MTAEININDLLLQKGAETQNNLLQLMSVLDEKGKENELPEPHKNYFNSQKHVEDNTYNVIVVGEAKRGKSSFINSLVGDSLLPTDVDISTARVIRISNTKQEAFRLRFEDGSAQEISRKDLFRFGSQKSLDEDESLENEFDGKILRWIEADVPTRFLSEGICLLDTPGTGALYAAHAEITQRFIPQADAVIFVLDSEQPILQEELNFLEQILFVTPNIFFIQTKIDRFDSEGWQDVKQRNEEIISNKIKEWLNKNIQEPQQKKFYRVDTTIWPVSNEVLLKASSAPENYQSTLLGISRFPDLEQALRKFLYRVSGWSRCLLAAGEADNYFRIGNNILLSRLTGLAGSGVQTESFSKLLQEREQQIQTQMLKEGKRLKKLKEDLGLQAIAIRQNMMQFFQVRDHKWDSLRDQIYTAKKVQNFERLEQIIPAEVTKLANEEWQNYYFSYERIITEYKKVRQEELDELYNWNELSGFTGGPVSHGDVSMSAYEILKGGARDYLLVGSISTALGQVVASIPFGPVVIFVAAAWAFIHGWKASKKQLIQRNQNTLLRFMDDNIIALRGQFLDIDVNSGKTKSLVDQYLQQRQIETLQEADQELGKVKTDLQNEQRRLSEQQKMDQNNREKAVKEARYRMSEWTGFGKQLENVVKNLQEMEEAFTK